jgi:hypothetical protein
MRVMNLSKENLISEQKMGTDLSTDLSSAAILVESFNSASLSLNWTGTFNGSFKIQICNVIGNDAPYAHDINSSVINVASGLYLGQTGFTYSLTGLTYRYIRIYYTFVSGTGTLTSCDLILKGA